MIVEEAFLFPVYHKISYFLTEIFRQKKNCVDLHYKYQHNKDNADYI